MLKVVAVITWRKYGGHYQIAISIQFPKYYNLFVGFSSRLGLFVSGLVNMHHIVVRNTF